MSQWSQVSRIALCMAKVKVTESVSDSVSQWQGHLLSCSGQLKSICQFSEKGRDLPRRLFQAETPSRILAVSSLAWTRLDTDKTARRRGSGSRLVSSGGLPLHCLSPSYQLDRKKATGSGELLLHFVNVFGVLEISINNNRPSPA